MSLTISGDTVTVTNTDPDEEVVLRYRPGSGRVNIASTGASVVIDMNDLIRALNAIKTTEDNDLARRRIRA